MLFQANAWNAIFFLESDIANLVYSDIIFAYETRPLANITEAHFFSRGAITKEICKVAVQPEGCAAALHCQAVFFFRFCIPSLPSRATQSSLAMLIIPAAL